MLALLLKAAQTKLLKFFSLKIFFICHRCRWHRWCTLSREYLREFSKKFEMAVMVYLDAWGKLIDEKNQKRKISWHCPFLKCPWCIPVHTAWTKRMYHRICCSLYLQVRINLWIWETENPRNNTQVIDTLSIWYTDRWRYILYTKKNSLQTMQHTNLCVLSLYILHGGKEEMSVNSRVLHHQSKVFSERHAKLNFSNKQENTTVNC